MKTRIFSLAGIAVLLALCIAAPQMLDAYSLGVALQLLSWIALTQSWVTFSGLTGYVSLGHAVFYGLGAYVMALLWQSAPLWEILLGSGFAGALLALVIGYPALRVSGPYFVILTLGLSEFFKYIVIAVEAGLESSGRLIFGAPDPETLYYIMLLLAVVATLLTWGLARSRWGAGLRAIREDETAAETLGVPVTFLKIAAFVISAFIPGVVGAVWVLRTTYFEPMQLFSPTTSFTIVTMAIIGGSDRAPGPIFGAAFIVLLSELLWARAPHVYLVILGVLLVSFVLFVPKGISGQLAWLMRRRRA
ncbi:branched-chain amino acid ABC transporter permease [Beijerinckia sp. L45]|uniref:branched-chain amino acid ABC transporter permease n=1 Tax=Beijerinckia sp. L45 TaxID=1641855 RepID=UPI00131B3495|nr:branched-chain amino acid ABC transporter permease [Beijerinckia sp. L45]